MIVIVEESFLNLVIADSHPVLSAKFGGSIVNTIDSTQEVVNTKFTWKQVINKNKGIISFLIKLNSITGNVKTYNVIRFKELSILNGETEDIEKDIIENSEFPLYKIISDNQFLEVLEYSSHNTMLTK